MPSVARRIAVEQLQRLEERDAYVSLLADVDLGVDVDPRDDRQATEYVAGVTRWRRWLDFLLDHFYTGRLRRLDPPLLHILRIGAYDVLFLRTPAHAAVNEAVELTRALVRPQAAGLTNAVLRNLIRSKDALPEPSQGSVAKRLAVRHSHPTWMVQRWLERFGESQTCALLAANNRRPIHGVRVNTLVTRLPEFKQALTDSGVSWEESPLMDYFVRLPQLQVLLALGFLDDGKCAVQDEGAGLVVRVLDPRPDQKVLDLCAAPGGKSAHAAQLMGDRGVILAVDVHAKRLQLVERTAASQRISIIDTLAADARKIRKEEVGSFDRVLVDAPCSGTGVLAKRADLRWQRKPADLEELIRLQADILTNASRLVRPGGLLVYATCSIEPDENERQVQRFLSNHPGWGNESVAGIVPEVVTTGEGNMATLPQEHGLDGAFAARLRRQA